MYRSGSPENMTKPWSPSSPKEVTLDTLTLGLTRWQRQQRIREQYAYLDECRLSPDPAFLHEVTPRLLPYVEQRAGAIAQLALKVASTAKVIHFETFQGYGATLIRGADGRRRASPSLAGTLHDPTLYRIKEATGRDYLRDIRDSGTLTVLMNSGDIEGLGLIANEYRDFDSKTGRVSDATFLIRGLPATIAGQFVNSLREKPAETLDGVMYTAFADIKHPGSSLLLTPANQPPDSLFIPGTCTGVTVVAMPGQ